VDEIATLGAWDKITALILAPPRGPRDVFCEGRPVVLDHHLIQTPQSQIAAAAKSSLSRLMEAA